jgi:hypothetical protein
MWYSRPLKLTQYVRYCSQLNDDAIYVVQEAVKFSYKMFSTAGS